MVSNPCKTDFRLDGKVAIITGAASGIGYATAKLFAEKGATVCMCDLFGDKVAEAAKEIAGAKGYAVNIADTASVEALVQAILADHGHIDILVNSAGVGDIEWAEEMSEKTWRKVIDINLSGTGNDQGRSRRKDHQPGLPGGHRCHRPARGVQRL